MCLTCWDADKKEAKIKMYGPDACLGDDMATMSVFKMQSELTEEWLETDKTDFRIFKAAIDGAQGSELSWTVTHPQTRETSTIKVYFV
jgi:hypothetical protein